MAKYYCCVAGCKNDSRMPGRYVIHSNVKELKFHYFPKDEQLRCEWVNQVSRGLVGFAVSNSKTVCSNHFEHGKPTFTSPTPTLFMTVNELKKGTPKKAKT